TTTTWSARRGGGTARGLAKANGVSYVVYARPARSPPVRPGGPRPPRPPAKRGAGPRGAGGRGAEPRGGGVGAARHQPPDGPSQQGQEDGGGHRGQEHRAEELGQRHLLEEAGDVAGEEVAQGDGQEPDPHHQSDDARGGELGDGAEADR